MSSAAPPPEPVTERSITLRVNDRPLSASVPVRTLLCDLLRDTLGLSGTHVGCEHGVCGACTVLLDGEPVRSCLTLALAADGRAVTTVEGLSPASGLSDLQRCFGQSRALQCGFCTPGLLATVSAAEPADYPDDAAIRELIAGHLCRCTGYGGIVAAVRRYWGREDG